MTKVKGEATLPLSYDTTSTDLKRFLMSLPEGRISVDVTQGDRPWESAQTSLTVSWVYDLDQRVIDDKQEMMGT